MFQTYEAILLGDKLQWSDTPPHMVATDQPIAMHVTILGDAPSGERMAFILEQLVQQNAFTDIADPGAWERSIRHERSLPERDTP